VTPAQFEELARGFDRAADEYLTRSGTRGGHVWLHPASLELQTAGAVLVLQQDRLAIVAPDLSRARDVAVTLLSEGAHLVGDLRSAALVEGRARVLAARSADAPIASGRGRDTSDIVIGARTLRIELDLVMQARRKKKASALTVKSLAALWGVCSDSTLRAFSQAKLSPAIAPAVHYALARLAQIRLADVKVGPGATAWIAEALGLWFARFESEGHPLARQHIQTGVELMIDANALPPLRSVPLADNLDDSHPVIHTAPAGAQVSVGVR
jgi:hypothetical protein